LPLKNVLHKALYDTSEEAAKMDRLPRKAYTYEFKMEAVRLVESRQSKAEAARSLGVVEQIEIRHLRAELARIKMKRDILGKAMAFFAKGQK
jgi:transposase